MITLFNTHFSSAASSSLYVFLDNFWQIEDFIERDKEILQEKYGIGDLK